MTNSAQKIAATSILLIWVIGLFLPYDYGDSFDLKNLVHKYYKYYSWQTTRYYLLFIPGLVIIGMSFSTYIAWRLFIIRTLLILYIPITLVVILADSSFMEGNPFPTDHGIGCAINYTCLVATTIFGILHFRSSYPKFKEMLNASDK